MKISCGVIGDILPLYADDLTSTDTKKLVREHLKDCAKCRGALEGMCNEKAPSVASDDALRSVAKSLRKKQILTALTAVLTALAIVASVISFLTVPVWLDAEDAVLEMESLEDGRFRIKTQGAIHMFVGDTDVGILCWDTRWDQLFPKERPAELGEYDGTVLGNTKVDGQVVSKANERNYWYLSYLDGTRETLLWQHHEPVLGVQGIALTGWLLWAFWLALGAFVLCGACAFLFWRNRAGKWFLDRCIFFGSYAFASLLVTSGKFMVFENYWEKLIPIAAVTLLITAAAVCFLRLRRLEK